MTRETKGLVTVMLLAVAGVVLAQTAPKGGPGGFDNRAAEGVASGQKFTGLASGRIADDETRPPAEGGSKAELTGGGGPDACDDIVYENSYNGAPYYMDLLPGQHAADDCRLTGTARGVCLVVNDGLACSDPDVLTISVQNVNDPPVCALGQASPTVLWPPNHKMVPVRIVGVTDANNDSVVITILGVTQDEPINGLGDGDTSPDAVIQGAMVLLRAERSGTGNGRVYRVTFEATDGLGGVCTGSVTVCGPHDKGQGSNCIDDGQIYNSLAP